MPGIVQVAVADGQRVTRGTTLLVLEAMKMERDRTRGRCGGCLRRRRAMVEEGVDLVAFEGEAASERNLRGRHEGRISGSHGRRAKLKASLPAIIIFCLAAGVGLGGIPALDPILRPPAALVVLTIGLWATGALQEHLVAVLFFLVAMIFSVSEPSVVFSGFAAEAFWLVFGGMVIGVAVERTGLGRRAVSPFSPALWNDHRRPDHRVDRARVSDAVHDGTDRPSDAGRDGHGGRPRVRRGAEAYRWCWPCCSAPTCARRNPSGECAEQRPDRRGGAAGGIQILYLDYLILHFPVLGFLKALVVWGVTVWFYNDTPASRSGEQGADVHSRLPMSGEERRLTLLLIVALILWGSDAIHGISPAWISLAAGLACLLPWPGLVPPDAFKDKMQMSPLLYVAGILGVGALVAESGLGAAMSAAMLDVVPLDPAAPAMALRRSPVSRCFLVSPRPCPGFLRS